MPPHIPANGSAAIDFFHEERIQRLEKEFKDVTKHSVQIEYLEEKFDELGQQLTDKLQTAISPMLKMGEAQSAQIEKMSSKLTAIDTRIEVLERDKAAKERHWGTVKKIMMGIVLAAAGVLGTKLMQSFLS